MELPVVNHEDYFAKIGDDHKFPMNKFSELANYLIKKNVVKKFHKPYPCSSETLKLANSEKYKSIREQNYKQWHSIQSEDLSIIEGMQEGRQSPIFNGGNFSPIMDNPTHHFNKWVAQELLSSY